MKRLPFFLSMGSCPRRCIYCHQGEITGTYSIPSPEDVLRAVSAMDSPCEICFFGGSFTCFPPGRQKQYLETVFAAPSGSTVRFSTHPECISRTVLKETGQYPVSMIELGISSLDDRVLKVCNRGYSGEEALASLRTVLDEGFHAGVQMMIGLPGQARESSLQDLRRIDEIRKGRPVTLRIYPCLVLDKTPLAELCREGKYTPLSVNGAAIWAGELLNEAVRLGFSVQRIGLQESESLNRSVIGGPHHPALGELARSAALSFSLKTKNPEGPWNLPSRSVSLLTGHGEYGFRLLSEITGLPLSETKHRVFFSNGDTMQPKVI